MLQSNRPTPQDVARRAFALAVYMFRVSYEEQWANADEKDRQEFGEEVADMGDFLRSSKLSESLSSNERILFGRPLGKWHPSDVKQCGWRGENLLVLLWALKINDLPPIWQLSSGVQNFASETADRWREFIDRASLHAKEELEQMEGYVQSIRLREQTPDGFDGIPWLAQKANEFGGAEPIEGDLTIDGRPFRLATKEQKSSIRSVALERHKALYWLLGYEVDLDAPDPEV